MQTTPKTLARILCALLATSQLTACAARNFATRAAQSQSRLDDQSQQLGSAAAHLREAHRRLAQEPDPKSAATEVDASLQDVTQAAQSTQHIRQDITDLSSAAQSLQHQLDARHNDLLGPRAQRIRNRVILLATLAALGWGLLQLGPTLGGPLGGGAIVAGHLLTAFAFPLLHAAWSALRSILATIIVVATAIWTRAISALNQLGSTATRSTPATTTLPTHLNPQPTGAAHAATGSD
ncbi:MAG: hypothetical protein M3O30_16400 [Planctomycetota bacterium]|nr:hypothetical protein [Planctomycetota bacterium]